MSKPTMSPEQVQYMTAKALYETAMEAHCRDCAALDYEADFDAAHDASEANRLVHNMDELSDLLRAAEAALLTWSLAKALTYKRATSAQKREIRGLYERAWLPTVRTKLLDIALRLAA